MNKSEALLKYQRISRKLIALFFVGTGLVILFIFILTSKTQSLVQKNIELSEVINVSGRQRMLSQNITKNIVLSYFTNDDSLGNLSPLLSHFKASHQFLERINLEVLLPDHHKTSLVDLFQKVDTHHTELVEITELALAKEIPIAQEHINTLRKAESQFLPLMDEITDSYQTTSSSLYQEVKHNVKVLSYLISGIVLLIASSVLVGTLYIIRKFSYQLDESMISQERSNIQLEDALANKESKVKELKKVTKFLNEAKEEADRNSRAKTEFLSTMSHEIRTPMNAIIGAANILELENPEIKQDERFKLLKISSNNLLLLINDILDYQKINTGNISLNEGAFSIGELVENTVSIWRPLANDKDIELIAKIDESLHHKTHLGDFTRINQVLNNIVNNAIKFTDDGMVQLCVKESKGGIYFEVKDTGIGIPQESLESIFEQFSQVDCSTTQQFGGTGLGLAISKEIVKLMGGTIEVESKVGFGSKFFFTLDLEVGESEDEEVLKVMDEKVQTGSVKILIVEDNIGNQTIVTGFLDLWGFGYEIANNGKEALEKVNSKDFDLVLMDLRMPVMNGFDAAAGMRSRNDPYFKDLPIIALSASTFSETKTQIYEAGMNDFLSKPFSPEDLHNRILKHLVLDAREAV